ncbi:glycosyl hydrolase 115 family protein [Olivibacter sp. SDN3]|uniref:sialate O-acetylesterase n=1 Tax=Olivibacter sp. SDN3 TaxID=2764720 RepID=UPI001650DEC0|nr:sialate O-acetylesterase [Olivibacter sp. SDN3]QNL51914.1 glycosyl hydrolase 115 family protein [Olivibacter sp. SDN3]
MTFLFVLACGCPLSTYATNDALLIRGGVPVYVHPEEPAPVRRAVQDLLRDLEGVFGRSSALIDTLPKDGAAIVVATGDRHRGRLSGATGWEAHQVYTDGHYIVLNGADTRGTVYAIYTFSESCLGIKPLWRWTSEKPVPKKQISIPGQFHQAIPSPRIKYRAWFPNDRDLLDPWQRNSEENYEALYETMLRLKVNTLEGGITDARSFSPPYPLGREAAMAQERGLLVTGHHMRIFGSSYNHWDAYWKNVRQQQPPALEIANVEALEEWWRYHAELAVRHKLDMIWLVGFRGNRDIPFWEFFPDSPKDPQDRADVIAAMVRSQIGIVKEATGDPHPLMRLTLYNEMSTLVANGHFKLPNEPSLIRNFVAARRDHFPAPDIMGHSFSGEPTGYYLNFQFTSSGSHLAQAEGPRKMEQNFRMVDSLSGGNLVFSVVNAGNIREHVLELSANAKMMWDFDRFDCPSFYTQFCNKYFGQEHGPGIAKLYPEFFNSYWQQKESDIPGFERQYLFQDMRYARAAETLMGYMEKDSYPSNPLDNHALDDPDKGSAGYFRVRSADQLNALLEGTAASIIKLEKVTAAADRIHSQLTEGKRFFDDNLRGQAHFMLHLNRMLHQLTKAYQSHEQENAQLGFLQESLQELRAAEEWLRRAEHDIFDEWYSNDNKFGLEKIKQRLTKLTEPSAIDTNFHVYLLVGQSNMAGRGKLDSASKIIDSAILTLDSNGMWVHAMDPIHFDKSAAGVGPGISFAREMLAKESDSGIRIGLIPCAVGGTSIDRWFAGEQDPVTKAFPYDDAIRRANVAMRKGVLKGILWHQGEANNSKERAAEYPNKLVKLVHNFRRDLNGDFPFVVGEIGYFKSQRPINDVLNQSPTYIPHSAVVSAEGLKDVGDRTHFDTPSARLLGKRYAEAMYKLIGKSVQE